MNTNLIRRAALAAAAGAASLALAACGSSNDSSAGHDGNDSSPSRSASASASASATAPRGQHNAADLAFAEGMIPHHRQAVEMADLAPDRAGSAEVKKLADEIKKAQDPEIRTLSGWLVSWGEQVPAEGAMNHSMHGTSSTSATSGRDGMGGMGGMGGMMTAEDMNRLKKTSGDAFDTAFMHLMIKHHEGAVDMARTEKAAGSFPAAKKMANAIIASQTAEISWMNKLLGMS
ncbi:DUF305 domain-containing protein [Streptomyces kunmingensis]|uniref:DUF305 domain-containing protein n=1 Tax=Streptomyces kunmingensis TaxID=68225 RepID=A0ABU6CME0_9ACTN|nr:DUF305 domain-containing protein [Streptomyces kunmingensis]MEB3965060.1 DUF305 domain-containing protein [Streptomyces kunmingensis]